MKKLVALSLIGFSAITFGQGDSKSAPTTFHLDKVGFVMLGVANVPAAVAFYHGKLGLPVTLQTDDLAQFSGGSVSITVSSEVGRKVGDEEVVFVVDHVEAAFDALTRAGITFEVNPHSLTETAWAASFHDPDGHVLSIYGAK